MEYTVSCYIKSDSNITIKMGGATAASPINVTTEWVRHTITHTNSATTTAFPQITSNGTAGTVYIYGFQLEQQSFATSYLPTQGAISTRLRDIATNSGNATLINSESGVLYAEISALADGVGGAISLSDGTSNNYIYLYFHPSGTKIVAKIVLNSITVYDKNITSLDEVNYNKIAFKYQDSSFKIFANGVNISSLNQNSGNTFPINILNKLSFDNGAGSLDFYGKTKALAVYKTALTDEQLTALTTI